jgi:prepilin-type N-terminal cleavage/methylation domain-containing protein
MSGNRIRGKYGFTLIEILIVVALLGAFLIGLLATIDPFEQLKKGADAARLEISSNFYNAMIRSYATKSELPVADTILAAPLNSPEGASITHTLEQAGELKINFSILASSKLNDIYLTATKDGTTLSVCFLPKSKSYKKSSQAIYDKYGNPADCSGMACYVCVGKTDPSLAIDDSQGSGATCKTEDSECQVNSSAKPCCTGLTCVPYSQSSENGKCQIPQNTPTPTPPVSSTCPGQLLVNGSFESYDANRMPTGWTIVSQPPNDGVVCNYASDGLCSDKMFNSNPTLGFQTLANSQNFYQDINLSLPVNSYVVFSIDGMEIGPLDSATRINGGGILPITLYFSDGTTYTTGLMLGGGTLQEAISYMWKHHEYPFQMKKPLTKIRVKNPTIGAYSIHNSHLFADNICVKSPSQLSTSFWQIPPSPTPTPIH